MATSAGKSQDPNSTVRVGSEASHVVRGPSISPGPTNVPRIDRPVKPSLPPRSGPNLRVAGAVVALVILAAIGGLAALSLVRDGVGGANVDLEAIQATLSTEGIAGVSLSLGDEPGSVVIAGEVANPAERDRTISIVSTSDGVVSYDSQLTVGELPIAAATVTATDAGPILDGTVPGEAQRDELLKAVRDAYPAGNDITDNLAVDPDTRGLTVTVDGDLSDSGIFKALTRNLGQVSQANGTTLVLASGADDVLNRLFAGDPILFESGTAQIVADSQATLQEAAELLLLYPDVRLEVGGHTDTRGAAEMNQALSLDRANAVVSGLRDLGIANELVARGYGESQPFITPDDTAEQQQANRRIEFRTIN